MKKSITAVLLSAALWIAIAALARWRSLRAQLPEAEHDPDEPSFVLTDTVT